MSYLPYVIGAYAVFAGVLLWDIIVPQWHIRRELRAARRRAARTQPRAPSQELSR